MLQTTDRLLTLKEAARVMGTTPRYLWNKIRDGKGPKIIHIGKKLIRIRRDDFDNWLKAHEK